MTIESCFTELVALIERETTALSLPAGASDQEIDAVQESIGLEFPEQLKALYRMHNGEFEYGSKNYLGLFCDYQFLSLSHTQAKYASIRYVHRFWSAEGEGDPCEYCAVPAGSVNNTTVDLGWLPIGDCGGNGIAVDLNPGPLGVKGQIINYGRDDFIHYQIAPDLLSFLQLIRDQYAKRRWHTAFGDENWTSLYDALKQERGDPFLTDNLPTMKKRS